MKSGEADSLLWLRPPSAPTDERAEGCPLRMFIALRALLASIALIARLPAGGERRPREAQLACEVAVDEDGRLLDMCAAEVPDRDLARERQDLPPPVDRAAHVRGERAPRVLAGHEDDALDWPLRPRRVDDGARPREPDG